ncbi:MAG: class I SAM-dependent methyltransferase [Eubacteriales bacterium]|nr:class I SAM-dependent methyltransferase [Eubacteriales bacterium]
MSCYGPLASWYDSLTGDVPYSEFADFYEKQFAYHGGEYRLLLDLFCGTGTLTFEMADRGYEMIAVDGSEDMLMQAQAKTAALDTPPLFLCQEASGLDLYGTVDAAYCSLDGMNYIPPEELPGLFHRLKLFIRPQGLLIFDIRSIDWLKSMDGQIYVDETDDCLCLWRAELSEDESCICYGMDIFSRRGKFWARQQEEHIEYLYGFEELKKRLSEEGFEKITLITDGPQGEAGRLFITAVRSD